MDSRQLNSPKRLLAELLPLTLFLPLLLWWVIKGGDWTIMVPLFFAWPALTWIYSRKLEKMQEEFEHKRAQELKAMQEQIVALQKQQKESSFPRHALHDYNNILGAIMMYNELLSTPDLTPDKREECVKKIEQAVARGVSLTRQLRSA